MASLLSHLPVDISRLSGAIQGLISILLYFSDFDGQLLSRYVKTLNEDWESSVAKTRTKGIFSDFVSVVV